MKKLCISLAVLFVVSFAAWAVVTGPNFNLPDATSMTKISDSFEQIRTNEVWLAKDDIAGSASNKPTGTMAWDKTNKYLQQWNGSAWANFNQNFPGNVGIYTASPGYALDISYAFGIYGGADYYNLHYDHSSRTNGVAKTFAVAMPNCDNSYPTMMMLGTMSSGNNNLFIGGGNNYSSLYSMTYVGIYTGATSTAGTGTEKLRVDTGVVVNDPGADVDFRVEGDTDANLLVCDASTDRVGIGTAAPQSKLHVSDGGTTPGLGTNSDAGLIVQNNSSASAHARLALISGKTSGLSIVDFGDSDKIDIGQIYYDHAANGLHFVTNSTEKMSILADGKVGIGTASPSTALTVAGAITRNASASLPVLVFPDTQTSPASWALYAGATGVSLGSNEIGITNGANWSLRMTTAGGVADVFLPAISSGAGTYALKWTNTTGKLTYDTSGRKYKMNFQPIQGDALEMVKALKPQEFDYKSDHQHDMGFIAEDVAEVCKTLAIFNEKGEADGVKYDRMTALLCKAIQEQQQRIEQLTEALSALERRVK